MKNMVAKALSEAFDAHEKHREAMSESRRAHKAARDADEKVRHIRRLERERAQSRSGRGRAA